MSYPAYPPPPRKPLPASAAIPKAPSRRRNTGLLVAVLLVLFFGASAIGLLLFLPYYKAMKNSQIAADRFLRNLEKSNYKAVYDQLAYRGEDSPTVDDVRAMMTRLRKRKGGPTGHKGPEQWKIDTSFNPAQVHLVYRETYKKAAPGAVTLIMKFEYDEGRWLVDSLDFSK